MSDLIDGYNNLKYALRTTTEKLIEVEKQLKTKQEVIDKLVEGIDKVNVMRNKCSMQWPFYAVERELLELADKYRDLINSTGEDDE